MNPALREAILQTLGTPEPTDDQLIELLLAALRVARHDIEALRQSACRADEHYQRELQNLLRDRVERAPPAVSFFSGTFGMCYRVEIHDGIVKLLECPRDKFHDFVCLQLTFDDFQRARK